MIKHTHRQILIANATSPRNLGDNAILDGILVLFSRIIKENKITIHSSESELYVDMNKYHIRFSNTFYNWAVFQNKNILVRIWRMMNLLILLIGIKFSYIEKLFTSNRILNKLFSDYKKADLIFLAGGGYLRSKKGIKQTLNLLMQFYPFLIAILLKKKFIVGSISLGPFAYSWQEKLSVIILKKAHLVAVRENISFQKMKEMGMKNIKPMADLAFLLQSPKGKKKSKSPIVIGISLRNWFQKSRQLEFENEVFSALRTFSKSMKIIIQPIAQVNSPQYGDFDLDIAKRLYKYCINSNLSVSPIRIPENVEEAFEAYQSLDLLIGMRMHANILASIVGVPFVSISYEHKTEGIAKQLGMSEYCIKCEKVTRFTVGKLIQSLYRNKHKLHQQLVDRVGRIRVNEMRKWVKILDSTLKS